MLHITPISGTLWPMAERGVLLPGLQRYRRARFMNQKQLAAAAGVARSTIIRGEAGKRVDFEVAGKLARALGVDTATLAGAEVQS
jgi:DNA-binding XRE family transcriptional regulator